MHSDFCLSLDGFARFGLRKTELYEGLDTKEGEKTLYRLARHQAGKDVQQVRMMKDTDGNVMTDEESVLRMWKEYYMGLMNEENEREREKGD